MDDASTPGQKKPEVPRGEKNLLLRGEEEDVKAKLDWGVEGLRDDTPAKVKDGQDVAQEQQQVLAGVVKPQEVKTLGQRFEEMRRTREEREIEKLRKKSAKGQDGQQGKHGDGTHPTSNVLRGSRGLQEARRR